MIPMPIRRLRSCSAGWAPDGRYDMQMHGLSSTAFTAGGKGVICWGQYLSSTRQHVFWCCELLYGSGTGPPNLRVLPVSLAADDKLHLLRPSTVRKLLPCRCWAKQPASVAVRVAVQARQQELLSFAHAAASQPRFTTLPSLAAFKQRMAAPPSTPAPAPSLNAHPQGAADGSAQPGPACSNELLVAPTAAEDSMPPASNSLQPSQPDTAAAAHTPSDSEQAAAAAPPAAADLELPDASATLKLQAEHAHKPADGADAVDTDQTATEVHPHVDADSRQASSQGTADGSGSTRVDNVKTDELHEVFRQHDADENIASSAADSRQQESAASAPISAAVNDAAVHACAAQQAVAEGVQQGGSSNVVSSDDDSTAVSDEQKPSLAVHTPDQTGGLLT